LKRRVGTDPRNAEILEAMSGVLTRGTQTIDLLRNFSRQTRQGHDDSTRLPTSGQRALTPSAGP
jgi:hypothetical protein